MVYRVRYRDKGKPRQCEAVIDANSPNEALVKFHHSQPQQKSLSCTREVVSVFADNWPAVSCY